MSSNITAVDCDGTMRKAVKFTDSNLGTVMIGIDQCG